MSIITLITVPASAKAGQEENNNAPDRVQAPSGRLLVGRETNPLR